MRCVLGSLVLWISTASCQYDVGDPCPEDSEPPEGVCKRYEDCPYAAYMLDVLKKKLTYCSIDDFGIEIKRVVCCPNTLTTTISPESRSSGQTTDKDGDIPFEMNFLEGLQAGIYRTDNTVCRFDGNYPITCYRQEYPRHMRGPKREPEMCPDLNWPDMEVSSLSPRLQAAWEACRNYSLEGSPCHPSPTNLGYFYREDCTDQGIEYKVADGEPAQITEYPHMALLGETDSTQMKKNKDIIWYGGGSLISEYFLLTAGHVIAGKDRQTMVEYAMLGATNKTDLKAGVIFQVVIIIAHPKYNMNYLNHDIALLELDRRVRFSEFIRPICLRVPGLQTTTERIIAGWGRIGNQKADSPILLKARIEEKSKYSCKAENRAFKWDSATSICAGAIEVGSGKKPDTCQGDSGGPLMAKTPTLPCSHVVVGVASWGPICGVGAPAIYVNVSNVQYLEWIASNVWPNTVKQKKKVPKRVVN